MLRNLSYLNLIMAVLYFLGYLQNGNALAIAGLLSVVVFSWLVLRSLEREKLWWSFPQWILSFTSLLYAASLAFSAVNLVIDSIGYQYFPANVILLIVSGLLFALLIILQLFFSLRIFFRKKTD